MALPLPAVMLTDDSTTPSLKPPLKWAGGKRWLVPHLRPLWERATMLRSRRLVEPFVGGMAVALGLNPSAALLNDINVHVINFYRWVQHGLTITIPFVNDRDAFYRARERFNGLPDRQHNREAAELFYYLNRTGYNGLCRFNRKGGFNVPFGRYKNINYIHDFGAYVPILSRWSFTSGDFAAIPTQPHDFIYADPPYDVEFTSYSERSFLWDDQVRLAEWLCQHPGPVVISNQATKRVMELYSDLGFRCETLPAPRMISCNGDRTPALEVIATRNIP
jgi:DNA adenine methylase